VVAAVLLGLGLVGAVACYPLVASPPPREAATPPAAAEPPARPAGAEPRKPAAAAAAAKEDGPSVKELPPVVVETVPRSGDTQVDTAKVKEVRVTFSKEMTDQSWSWSQVSDETFPKTTDKPHYDKDRRTCVLPVKLEPGKTYVIWLNSAKFGNFKDADGRSAVPYLLVFETKKE
jgi:RNA polymerase sigma-70 factor (ECF subfamily)